MTASVLVLLAVGIAGASAVPPPGLAQQPGSVAPNRVSAAAEALRSLSSKSLGRMQPRAVQADGVVIAEPTGESDSRDGWWGSCGKKAVKGWVVYRVLTVVEGESPGASFAAVIGCPSRDALRQGRHLIAWRRRPDKLFLSVFGERVTTPASLPVAFVGSATPFDGVIVARARQPTSKPCAGHSAGWAVYDVLSVIEGDSPGSPFVAVFFCPFVGSSPGRLHAMWRRDLDIYPYFREHPPRHLPQGMPIVYVDHEFYEVFATE